MYLWDFIIAIQTDFLNPHTMDWEIRNISIGQKRNIPRAIFLEICKITLGGSVGRRLLESVCLAIGRGRTKTKMPHFAKKGGLTMEHKELTAQLRRMSVETGSLKCLGCGYEHNCRIHGCALLRRAVETIERQAAAIEDLRDHECSGLLEE